MFYNFFHNISKFFFRIILLTALKTSLTLSPLWSDATALEQIAKRNHALRPFASPTALPPSHSLPTSLSLYLLPTQPV